MTKSALEPLICPQCGGDVDLDNNQEYGFCKYCGTKIQNTNFKIVKLDVKVKGIPTVDNFMILAKRKHEEYNLAEAIKYYKKILEIDANNWEALFRKNLCVSENNRLRGLSSHEITVVIPKIIDSNKDLKKDKNKILLLMTSEMYDVCKPYAEDIEKDLYTLNSYCPLEIDILEYIGNILKLIQKLENPDNATTKEKNKLIDKIFEIVLDVCKSIDKKMMDTDREWTIITGIEEYIIHDLVLIEVDDDSIANKKDLLLEKLYNINVACYNRLFDRKETSFKRMLRENELDDVKYVTDTYNEATEFLKKRNPDLNFEPIEEKLLELEKDDTETIDNNIFENYKAENNNEENNNTEIIDKNNVVENYKVENNSEENNSEENNNTETVKEKKMSFYWLGGLISFIIASLIYFQLNLSLAAIIFSIISFYFCYNSLVKEKHKILCVILIILSFGISSGTLLLRAFVHLTGSEI